MTDRGAAPDVDEIVRLGIEVDPALTLDEQRLGPRDPTVRFEGSGVWRSSRTREGPATTRISAAPAGTLRVMAWGPGARAAADAVPRLLGVDDDPAALQLPPGHLRDLAVRLRGLRFGRTDAVWPALVAAVCSQKVTSAQAQQAYLGIIARFGEDAPGPGGMRLLPEASVIADLPYYELHALGLEQRRAVTLIRAARRATWLEQAVSMEPDEARARLQTLPGIGRWTAAEIARRALGDPDALSLGDFHVPHMVCWALAREPRGSDRRMLELLEPYRGQRARVVRILERSGLHAPRYGPRLSPRRIERL